ncbi:MAG: M24 family metallopeptidase [Acidimicrobiia bacterium]
MRARQADSASACSPGPPFVERMGRARARMEALEVDVLLLSVGPDLPYLTGYEAMPLERLTMLVLPRAGEAVLVVPGLEAPRVTERPDGFRLVPWAETEDPVELVAEAAGAPALAAIGDRTWARFLLELSARMPATRFIAARDVMGELRAVKDDAEVRALRRAAAGADRVAAQLQGGEISLVGRTEAEVSADIGRRLLAEGHHRVNFAIVAAGPNAASPHHEPADRVIQAGEVVLCDFGGTMAGDDGVGYCSDITRCVWTGGSEPPSEFRDLYRVLHDAQQAAVGAAVVGMPCEDVDGVARRLITEGGYGDLFIHRTGHGIGIEEHEDPYLVGGNCTPLAPGHAFSIEPGIYVPGRWGARLEDIVVATAAGPEALNQADHGLVVVDV